MPPLACFFSRNLDGILTTLLLRIKGLLQETRLTFCRSFLNQRLTLLCFLSFGDGILRFFSPMVRLPRHPWIGEEKYPFLPLAGTILFQLVISSPVALQAGPPTESWLRDCRGRAREPSLSSPATLSQLRSFLLLSPFSFLESLVMVCGQTFQK